jgi:hypothetical protein
MAIQPQNRARSRDSQSQRRRFQSATLCAVLLFLAILSLSAGCAQLRSTATEAPSRKITESSKPNGGSTVLNNRREKATKPNSILARGQDQSQRKETGAQSGPSASAPPKKASYHDEGPQVKAAAWELVKSIGEVEKMKVCYVTKDDEWWVTFYQDIGPVIDVKQYIWNRNLERLEPFLVLKRVSKAKLADELKREEPGRRCDIISPPKKTATETPKTEKSK